jgi:titin
LTIVAGAGSISASWSAASSGGSTITDYVVEYSTNGSSWTTFNDGLSTATSATITGLTNGTAYYVRVNAENAAGSSTAVVSGSTATPKTTPSSPSISAIAAGDQSLSVAFTAGATGGSSITGYQYSINGGSTWTTASGTSSPITISSLTNGTSYQVALRAVNVVGNGDASNILSSTPRTVPNAPTISSIMLARGRDGFLLEPLQAHWLLPTWRMALHMTCKFAQSILLVQELDHRLVR